MEKLHAATLYLLRWGKLHPFETANYPHRIKVSLGLALWTVSMQLVNVVTLLVYTVQNPPTFTSLGPFLDFIWNFTWHFLFTIVIPIHFLYHAKKVIILNRKIDKLLTFNSIKRAKISTKSKLTILLFALGRIITIFSITGGIILEKLDKFTIFMVYNTHIIETVYSIIFVTYLTILAEYLGVCDHSLGKLFRGMRSSTQQSCSVTTEEE